MLIYIYVNIKIILVYQYQCICTHHISCKWNEYYYPLSLNLPLLQFLTTVYFRNFMQIPVVLCIQCMLI